LRKKKGNRKNKLKVEHAPEGGKITLRGGGERDEKVGKKKTDDLVCRLQYVDKEKGKNKGLDKKLKLEGEVRTTAGETGGVTD